jgi:5-formyltetrahydrofolate cyclo-ligase
LHSVSGKKDWTTISFYATISNYYRLISKYYQSQAPQLKRSLRKQAAEARDSLPQEVRRFKSREIEQRLCSLPEFLAADVIMFFASFRSEVETGPMIRNALGSGKRVVLPRVKGRQLALFEVKDFDKDVSPGAWGIPEPDESHPVALADIDLIITPGAAFDESGNRLGYGAGYYDRILPFFSGMTVALAFEAQIVPQVPADPHDVPVQKIVTEKRVIETNFKKQTPSSK